MVRIQTIWLSEGECHSQVDTVLGLNQPAWYREVVCDNITSNTHEIVEVKMTETDGDSRWTEFERIEGNVENEAYNFPN